MPPVISVQGTVRTMDTVRQDVVAKVGHEQNRASDPQGKIGRGAWFIEVFFAACVLLGVDGNFSDA